MKPCALVCVHQRGLSIALRSRCAFIGCALVFFAFSFFLLLFFGKGHKKAQFSHAFLRPDLSFSGIVVENLEPRGAFLFISFGLVSMLVYKGKCASCGCGRKSKKMKARPAACPIPDNFRLGLAHHSDENFRICKDCSREHSRQVESATPKPLQPYTPGRVIAGRRRASASPSLDIDRALPNRSQATRDLVQETLD